MPSTKVTTSEVIHHLSRATDGYMADIREVIDELCAFIGAPGGRRTKRGGK